MPDFVRSESFISQTTGRGNVNRYLKFDGYHEPEQVSGDTSFHHHDHVNLSTEQQATTTLLHVIPILIKLIAFRYSLWQGSNGTGVMKDNIIITSVAWVW